MKQSALDRAAARIEEQIRESEARTAALKVALDAVKVEVGSRVRRARTPKLVEKGGAA